MANIKLSDIGKIYPDGTRAVDCLNLDIADGEFLVLVGPSGCGKTTALRMIAGLEEISEGDISIGGKIVSHLEPRKRDIAMVFQNYALYPHMSVFENIAFPLRSQRIAKNEIRERVERTAALLGLGEMLSRRPRVLSGGQRQRVAMGRAIVRNPKAFLMDEPLSNLDAMLRVQMRAEISQLQRSLGATTVYVTHDQVEALTMGTRIAVMRKGILQQEGPPQDVYDKPANLFVATFIGAPSMNLFRGRLEAGALGLTCTVGDQTLVLPDQASAGRPGLAAYQGRDIAVGIRPDHLSDAAEAAEGALRLRGKVQLVESLGSERLVHLRVAAEPIATQEVMEIARDSDEAAVQALKAEVDERYVSLIAKFGGRTKAVLYAGDLAELAIDPDGLHFFAIDTGQAIY